MIKILYIDDNLERTEKVVSHLNDIYADKIQLIVVSNINHGKRELIKTKYHCLLLDVVLPLRDEEKPSSTLCFNFLKEIYKKRKFKKPDKIVGITAHMDEAPDFKTEFEEKNFFFLETPFNSSTWLNEIDNHIKYLVESQEDAINNSIIIPVHGIHSTGEWHKDFEEQINKTLLSFDIFPYEFTRISFIFFLIPFIRSYHVNLFVNKFKSVIDENPNKKVIIIAHSFGTYLVAESLKRLSEDNFKYSVDLLILAGSVLRTSYPIRNLFPQVKKIINDCGCNDIPLCLSQALVLGTGMAGRAGLIEINDGTVINRFFEGGHDLYFKEYKGQDFMFQHWVRGILDPNQIQRIDDRPKSSIRNIMDMLLTTIGPFKKPLFWLIALFATYKLNPFDISTTLQSLYNFLVQT